jgi:putative FmdB family regulatory protein
MPVYDYKCPDHGLFHELATMDDHAKPASCPQCGLLSSRVIMLAPEVLAMNKDKRQAHERNERSQHEPVFSNEDQRQHDHHHRQHCGCKPRNKSKLFYTAEGNKMFPSMRPWMISH